MLNLDVKDHSLWIATITLY